MSAVTEFPPPAAQLRRFVAGGLATLVLALSVFAASPVAHDWLHCGEADHGGAEDACAVVMLAQGVALPAALFVPTPPDAMVETLLPVAAAEVFLVAPRYLRQPGRGPPVVRIG